MTLEEKLQEIRWMDRGQLQAHLETRGFAVYDNESFDTLRTAAQLDMEESHDSGQT